MIWLTPPKIKRFARVLFISVLLYSDWFCFLRLQVSSYVCLAIKPYFPALNPVFHAFTGFICPAA